MRKAKSDPSAETAVSVLENVTDGAMPQIVGLQCLSSWLWLCYAAHNSTTQPTDHCCPSDMQTFVNTTSVHTCSTVAANLANIAFCQSS